MQDSDDLTRETLAVAAGSTKDKKKRQELKNTGQSYVNTKGKLVDAKRVWPQDCSRCVPWFEQELVFEQVIFSCAFCIDIFKYFDLSFYLLSMIYSFIFGGVQNIIYSLFCHCIRCDCL